MPDFLQHVSNSRFPSYFAVAHNRAKVVASTTPGRSQTRDPGALQRSARQLNDNFMLNDNFFLKDNLMLYNELL